jgi:hypothetical protein
MSEHWRMMARELPVLVHGRMLLWWWLRGVVDLGLQVGHSVGQVLQELHLILEKLLHDRIHWCWLWCTA